MIIHCERLLELLISVSKFLVYLSRYLDILSDCKDHPSPCLVSCSVN